jgi:hypothetical protein
MGIHQREPDERILICVVPREKLTKGISKLACLQIQAGRQPRCIAQVPFENAGGQGLLKTGVMVVESLK